MGWGGGDDGIRCYRRSGSLSLVEATTTIVQLVVPQRTGAILVCKSKSQQPLSDKWALSEVI